MNNGNTTDPASRSDGAPDRIDAVTDRIVGDLYGEEHAARDRQRNVERARNAALGSIALVVASQLLRNRHEGIKVVRDATAVLGDPEQRAARRLRRNDLLLRSLESELDDLERSQQRGFPWLTLTLSAAAYVWWRKRPS